MSNGTGSDQDNAAFTAAPAVSRGPLERLRSFRLNKTGRIAAQAALMVVLLSLPAVFGGSGLSMRILNVILIYSLLSMGLNVITGCTGLFDTGHAAFYGIGAYASALLMMRLGLPWIVGFIAAAVLAGIAGFLIAFPCLKVQMDFLGLITTAFGTVFTTIALYWMPVTNGPIGIAGIRPPSIAGYVFNTPTRYYYLFLAIVVLVYIALHNILNSRVGRAFYSIRDDETCAAAQGINIRRYKVLAFVLGTIPAGMAGSMAAHYLRFISPDPFGFNMSSKVMSMIILGGLGSLPGSIVGTIFFVILPEVFRPLAVYEVGIAGAVMVVLMLFRPQGLMGSAAFAGEGGFIGRIRFWRQRLTQQSRQRARGNPSTPAS